MSFLATHRANIKDRQGIQYSEMRPGYIVAFRYVDKSGRQELELVLVTNIYPLRGGRKTRKMHGLLLKNMPIPIFNRLVNRFYNEFRFRSVDYLVDTNYIEKSLQILNLVFEGGEDGDKTYYRHLKRFDRYDLYRTYRLDKMTGIKKITYDFSKFDIQKKLIDLEIKKLPKEEPTEEEPIIEETMDERGVITKEEIDPITLEKTTIQKFNVSERMKKDAKYRKLRGEQIKIAVKELEKVVAKLKNEKIKFNLQLREINIDTGVYG
jgi:hypothetical protein